MESPDVALRGRAIGEVKPQPNNAKGRNELLSMAERKHWDGAMRCGAAESLLVLQ